MPEREREKDAEPDALWAFDGPLMTFRWALDDLLNT